MSALNATVDSPSRFLSTKVWTQNGLLRRIDSHKEKGLLPNVSYLLLFNNSQAEGEQLVRSIFPSATVVRPSAMYGQEDRFLARLASK